ncbi:hypothetical protein IGI04_042481 [Brassica rapa subsp. trilocularis]|uniref:Uncharacterized protein n=1 Tax=Brassica rapa subsp. trilocularis TaxID=1813537 RepID=A0ABQ7KJ92_BRACM|nr:hypothetical protein IGI04_042481 [Brassica rapa subsp. trilocularis]
MVKTAVGSKGLWKHITSGNDGNGKSLVAYTGASSSRSNDDYIKRSDLDALFKMLKENGNTYGYSFGASMIAYKDDHLIRELGGEEHEEPMQEANQDEGGVENEGEESIGSDDFIRRSEMDALIKMLKENGNTHGYSFGASMIAKTIETSPCVTDIARMDRVKCNEQARHEIQMWGVGTNMRVLRPLLELISHLTLIVRWEGNLKLKKMVRMEPA